MNGGIKNTGPIHSDPNKIYTTKKGVIKTRGEGFLFCFFGGIVVGVRDFCVICRGKALALSFACF